MALGDELVRFNSPTAVAVIDSAGQDKGKAYRLSPHRALAWRGAASSLPNGDVLLVLLAAVWPARLHEPHDRLGVPNPSRNCHRFGPRTDRGDALEPPRKRGACAVSGGRCRRSPPASCVAAPTAVHASPRSADSSSRETVGSTTGREGLRDWLLSSGFRTRGNLIANQRSDARRSRVAREGRAQRAAQRRP